MKKLLLSSIFVLTSIGLCSVASAKSDLLTSDRVGPANAPNTIKADIMTGHTYLNALPYIGTHLEPFYLNWVKHNPKWKIKLNPFTISSTRQVQLLEQLRAGVGPDCSTIDSFHAPVYAKYLQPIESYFTKAELKDRFPRFLKVATDTDGHLKFLWFSTDVRVIYYFKDLFNIKKTPTTWKEFEQDLTKAHQSHPDKTALYVSGSRYESTSNDWYGFYWQQGGKLVDKAGKPVFGDKINRPKMIKALSLYQRLSQKGIIPRSVTSMRNANNLIGDRKVIAWLGGNWLTAFQTKLLESSHNGKYAKQIGFFTIPSYNGRDYAVSTGGYAFGVFTKDKAKAQACVNIVKEVFRDQLHRYGGGMPTIFSAYKSGHFATKEMNKFKTVADKYGMARPTVPIYPEISSEMQSMLSEILSGKKLDLGKSVDKAYKKMLRSYKRMSRHHH